jgi:hypothetical protein
VKRRRRFAAVLGGFALVGAGLVVGFNRLAGASADESNEASARAATSTARVERRDLNEQEELAGTLGYGEPTDLVLTAQGTITWLPPLGAVIDRGGTLLALDGQPVQLWIGTTPLWRELDANASDGVDVQQVEENLVALGYATAEALTVDAEWTSATTAAIKEWQEALGVDDTGSLGPSDVVMWAGPVRVAELPTTLGSQASGPVLGVTGTARIVTVDLEATKQTLVPAGDRVEVVVPGGAVLAGAIYSIGTVAEAAADGDPLNPSDPTIPVTIVLTDPAAADIGLDEAPVVVRITTSSAQGVLAVPVDALIAVSGGGFAVELVTTTGTQLVRVEPGAFAAGFVAVTGDLSEGDEVVVPA